MPKKTNKRPKKNGYVMFCHEKQQTNPALAKMSMPELVEKCSDMWEALRPEERLRFAQMAKEYNDNNGLMQVPLSETDFTGRFDSQGNSLKALQEKEDRQKFYHNAMNLDIRMNVEKARDANLLTQTRIHIMSVNTWLEVSNGDVYPAEIGLVTMTLFDGITQRFNQIVDPGEFPLGYRNEAKINSEKYHHIWLDNEYLGQNYYQMMDRIRSVVTAKDDEPYAGQANDLENLAQEKGVRVLPFVKAAKENRLRPIFVMPSEKARVIKAIRWLLKKADVDYEFTFYDLHTWFYEVMKVAPLDMNRRMSLNIAEEALSRDVFLYVLGVSCDYHESISSSLCAGGKASRLAYIISDYCCQLFAITPLEGHHVPDGVEIDDFDPTEVVSEVSDLGKSLQPEMVKADKAVIGEPDFKGHLLGNLMEMKGPNQYERFDLAKIIEGQGGPKDLPEEVIKLIGDLDLTTGNTTFHSLEEAAARFEDACQSVSKDPTVDTTDDPNQSFYSVLESVSSSGQQDQDI